MTIVFNTIESFYDALPTLRDVRPSLPAADWRRRELDVDKYFQERAEGLAEYRLPLPTGPVSNPHGWCVPVECFGDCLSPIVEHGDRLLFDARRRARDGDVVLAVWSEANYQSVVSDLHAQQFESQYGVAPTPTMVKVLVSVAGDLYLVHRDGAMLLADTTVVGVLVGVARNGIPLYQGERECQVRSAGS